MTEDSGSRYQFFQASLHDSGMECESSRSKTKIFDWLQEHWQQRVFVVADGAAFGPEIDRISKWKNEHPGQCILFLPESFEWLLLKSGVIRETGISEVLNHPEKVIDSREYISWERFFTDYLEKLSVGTIYAYSKRKINPYYTAGANRKKIMALVALPGTGQSG